MLIRIHLREFEMSSHLAKNGRDHNLKMERLGKAVRRQRHTCVHVRYVDPVSK